MQFRSMNIFHFLKDVLLPVHLQIAILLLSNESSVSNRRNCANNRQR